MRFFLLYEIYCNTSEVVRTNCFEFKNLLQLMKDYWHKFHPQRKFVAKVNYLIFKAVIGSNCGCNSCVLQVFEC